MYPERIVCLTEETTEFIYLLGEQDRIVGVSAYACRPPQVTEEKPVVSAFVGGSVAKIKALEPDLVIGFSDVQADLARDLIHANLPVLVTNQRTISEILDTLLLIGRIVGQGESAHALVEAYRQRLERIREERSARKRRPRVYFEEWHDPMISAIEWVSELIEVAGGENIFADRASGRASKERFVTDEEVATRSPDMYIGCWCGQPLDRDHIHARPGLGSTPALRNGRVYEMDPAVILQPGPACLTDGLDELCQIVDSFTQ